MNGEGEGSSAASFALADSIGAFVEKWGLDEKAQDALCQLEPAIQQRKAAGAQRCCDETRDNEGIRTQMHSQTLWPPGSNVFFSCFCCVLPAHESKHNWFPQLVSTG